MRMLHRLYEWTQLPSTVPLSTCPETGWNSVVRMLLCPKIERFRGFVAMSWANEVYHTAAT